MGECRAFCGRPLLYLPPIKCKRREYPHDARSDESGLLCIVPGPAQPRLQQEPGNRHRQNQLYVSRWIQTASQVDYTLTLSRLGQLGSGFPFVSIPSGITIKPRINASEVTATGMPMLP